MLASGVCVCVQPGVVKQGEVLDQQWGFWDFMATAVSWYTYPVVV